MSIHFSYDFKEELVEKIKKSYSKELKAQKEDNRLQEKLDDVEKTILDYFETIRNGLAEVFQVSDGEIAYEEGNGCISCFKIGKNQLEFIRKDRSIEVKAQIHLKEDDLVETKIMGHIVPSNKACIVKDTGEIHTGNHFDQNVLNYFMRNVFNEVL